MYYVYVLYTNGSDLHSLKSAIKLLNMYSELIKNISQYQNEIMITILHLLWNNLQFRSGSAFFENVDLFGPLS